VVIVRDQARTVMTMVNDFQGSARDFAVVIPVPTKIERGQIHVAEKAIIDHLDAYSSPRLVEYTDPDPCAPAPPAAVMDQVGAVSSAMAMRKSTRARSLGVTVEANTTSSSSPPGRAVDWKPGSSRTATRFRKAPLQFWEATSARTCTSSSPG